MKLLGYPGKLTKLVMFFASFFACICSNKTLVFINSPDRIFFPFSWWTVVEHLCWSLLGMSELDPLDSVDHPSETIARFLFGLFLVLGVILLINMMIALLSNTYQRVQVKLFVFLCLS